MIKVAGTGLECESSLSTMYNHVQLYSENNILYNNYTLIITIIGIGIGIYFIIILRGGTLR